MDEKLLEKTLLHIRDRFKNDYSGHDYYHSVRVYKLATTICKTENANLEIVQLAALLHDVDDYKLFGGRMGDFSNAESFLKHSNISKTKINIMCEIISTISFKGTGIQIPKSQEGKIVQDADRLDAMGAIGIARVFAYGGNNNRVLHIPDKKPMDDMNAEQYSNCKGTSINHFYEKLLKLRDLMNTKAAKELAESRHRCMEMFLEEFSEEWDGGK
ncbi:MAG: HD domain-containing protein [Negativicutes bacterium]